MLSLFLFDFAGEQQPVGLEYQSMMDDSALPRLSLYFTRPRVAYIHVSMNVFTRISLFNFNFLINQILHLYGVIGDAQ